MQDILLAAGVTVVSGRVKTALIGGVAVDICGLDDPAGLTWRGVVGRSRRGGGARGGFAAAQDTFEPSFGVCARV
jgi:hypothetical protein